MTEDEFKKFWEDYQRDEHEASKKRDAYQKEIMPGLLKIPIEGFVSDDDRITLSPDLQIIRVNAETRDEFFQRAASLELRDYRQENNWFFLSYKFEDQRGKIGGIETGNRILLIAIFFAMCSEKRVRINKSQGFVPQGDELRSIGITRVPNAPWSYESRVTFESEVIEEIRTLWPLFQDSFTNQQHFALVARRYYFSLIRNQWEDQLIDLIISLEALLVPETDDVNKSGKISKRLSRLLSKQFKRGEVSTIVKNCYNLRNEIVHGNPKPDINTDAYTLVEFLQKYVNAALKVYLLEYRNLHPKDLANRIDNMTGDQI
ncbi:MAG: hypothetical protein DI538_21740 [Azospira oryzae]|nr:MAG: hypothetical protein DI538_21740 [Azospira oryzae]